MMPRLTALHTIWLLTRMRCLRQRNLILHSLLRGFGRKNARDGNGGKRTTSWILAAVVALTMAISLLSISSNIVLNLQCHTVSSSACHQSPASMGGAERNRIAAAELEQAASFAPPLQRALAMELGALFLVSVLLSLGSKELAQPDWDLEWLVTLPASRSSLLWGRIVERSVANVIGIFLLSAAYGMIGWYGGKGWVSVPLALLAALALLPLAAVLQTLADTGLRMALPASQLRNLQALISLLGLPLMYLVIATSMPAASSFIMDWVRASPAWLLWTPPGLLLQAMQAPSTGALIASLCLFALQSIALLWGGVILLAYQLRHGVVRSGARETSRRIAQASAVQGSTTTLHQQDAQTVAASASPWLERLLSPIQRRELRLLSRDRNFLVQTLVLPLVIVFSQLIFNGKLDSLAELGQHHATTAAIAFSIGAYVLMLSAFQTLNNEGQVLWLLYTLPQSLNDILKQKARLWAVLGLLYPLTVFAISAYYTSAFTWGMLIPLLTALAGIPIYAILAVALGVFACNPHAVENRNKVKPTFIYLYMLLASFYIWSITASFWWQKLIVTVLITAMALALWQKARDAMPYLLDPAAAPPARVALADGLTGATAFFILQGVAVLIISDGAEQPTMRATTLGFISAGIIVYGLMRLYYWRAGTAGVPAILRGTRLSATLKAVVPAAALAIAAGLLALSVIRHTEYAPMLQLKMTGNHMQYWLLGLTVLAAPLSEEFIFRGLIFGGLRRTLTPLLSALISAAIFAVVHPPLSMLPVFVLGLCTAWAYQRSQTLLAPMLVHALYNAAVVTALLLG